MTCYNSYDEFVLLVIDGRGRLCHLSQLCEVLSNVSDGKEIFFWFHDKDGNEVYMHPISVVVHKNWAKQLYNDDEGDSEECDS